MTKLLEVSGLTVGYGDAVALDTISFDVARGEFVTFIGPNGAGKTTLLNSLMGVLRQKAGAVMFDGEDLADLKPEARVARGIVIVPERRELFPGLSVEDHLRLGAFLRRNEGREKMAAALERIYVLLPKLKERRRQLAGTLSGGEQQMVAVGRALMAEPKLLMLDEPSTGLAPRITEEIFEAIDQLKAHGMTGILVEQNAHLALSVADRGFVLEVGNVVASGGADDLKQDPRVLAAYLGAGDRYRETTTPES
ncbi:MAG: ABC transporter ATP-binding protein [Rhizobiales bacterium 62-47]|nr:ABC transporter ATP-binding protein [Hyphomicrobiales bacterium]OJY12788.1 MAG: ABC transporter ATP-binding protein [Rhizobiales bacterium 62-47]